MAETEKTDTRLLNYGDLHGIGGWLAFYVITTSLGAGTIIYKLWYPVFPVGMGAPLVIATVMALAVVLVCCKSRWALPFVAIELAVNALYLVYCWVRFMRPFGELSGNLSFALGIAVYLLWYLYFKTSRRVRSTLGRNLR